jgi:hypothetical protein
MESSLPQYSPPLQPTTQVHQSDSLMIENLLGESVTLKFWLILTHFQGPQHITSRQFDLGL